MAIDSRDFRAPRDAPRRMRVARMVLAGGALAMALAVALGAFGAHGLRARVSVDMLAVWQTAVRYHAWHGLALVLVGLLLAREPAARGLVPAAACFAVGIVLFSGSLYALVLVEARGLGALTPLGGVAFVAGWLTLAWAAWRG